VVSFLLGRASREPKLKPPPESPSVTSMKQESHVRSIDPAGDTTSTRPYSMFRSADGTVYWAAWCPGCAKRRVQTAVAGNERTQCVGCKTCGALVAVDLGRGGLSAGSLSAKIRYAWRYGRHHPLSRAER
jgi:hypothetical protein